MFLPGEPDADTAKEKSVFTAARLDMQFAMSAVWSVIMLVVFADMQKYVTSFLNDCSLLIY